MKRRKAIIEVVVVATVVISLFFGVQNLSLPRKQSAGNSGFYMGVECGYNNITLCKELIDNVKDYTNLFIVGSTDIVKNASLLNEVCDYAYQAGMHISAYFSPNQNYLELGENTTASVTLPNGTIAQLLSYQSTLPMTWLKNASSKYGDCFLGAYVFDEPGGNQLDGSAFKWNNTQQDYQTVANNFVSNINVKIQPYLNSRVMTFTSDYGLYWFDYKAGYDAILTELGGNNDSRQLPISLCRGAATAQGKDWGIMVTTRFDNGQVLESGPELYDDLVLGYNSGAKYAVVFDYALTVSPSSREMVPYQPYEYGILQDEHFAALRNLWTYIQQNPRKHGSFQADVALVVPRDFGFGFRNAQDTIWGALATDAQTQTLWSDTNNYAAQYGSHLDIVYDDPQFMSAVKTNYANVIKLPNGTATEP